MTKFIIGFFTLSAAFAFAVDSYANDCTYRTTDYTINQMKDRWTSFERTLKDRGWSFDRSSEQILWIGTGMEPMTNRDRSRGHSESSFGNAAVVIQNNGETIAASRKIIYRLPDSSRDNWIEKWTRRKVSNAISAAETIPDCPDLLNSDL